MWSETLLNFYESCRDKKWHWKIYYDQPGRKDFIAAETYEDDTKESAKDRLERAILMLEPGKYRFTCKENATDNKRIIYHFFEVHPQARLSGPPQPQPQQSYLPSIGSIGAEYVHKSHLDELENRIRKEYELKLELQKQARDIEDLKEALSAPKEEDAIGKIVSIGEKLLPLLMAQRSTPAPITGITGMNEPPIPHTTMTAQRGGAAPIEDNDEETEDVQTLTEDQNQTVQNNINTFITFAINVHQGDVLAASEFLRKMAAWAETNPSIFQNVVMDIINKHNG
jgi:hypothetical protein